MTTQKFSAREDTVDSGPFLLGVIYDDQNENDRYDPGEGIPNVEVRPAIGDYYAVTSESDGYAIPFVPASGGAMEIVNLPFPVNGTPWSSVEPHDSAFREQKLLEAPLADIQV